MSEPSVPWRGDALALIEETLLEFLSLRGDRHGDATAGEPLYAGAGRGSVSVAGLPAVQQGNLAALEDDDVREIQTQRHRVVLGIVVVLVLAAAALAWFAA